MRCFSRAITASLAGLIVLSSAWAADPTVQLLDAGTGTPTVLRHAPKAGDLDLTLDLSLKVAMDMAKGDAPRQNDKPPLTYTLDGVVEVLPNQQFRYTFTVAEITVGKIESKVASEKLRTQNAAFEEQVRASMEEVRGTTGELVITDRGFPVSLTFTNEKMEGNSFANLRKALTASIPIFPEEPVGTGAKWTATLPVQDNGIDLIESRTTTLDKRSGSTSSLTTSITHEAKEMKVPIGNGLTADLVGLQSKGIAETTFVPTKLFATGTFKHGIETRVLVLKNGQSMNLGLMAEFQLTSTPR